MLIIESYRGVVKTKRRPKMNRYTFGACFYEFAIPVINCPTSLSLLIDSASFLNGKLKVVVQQAFYFFSWNSQILRPSGVFSELTRVFSERKAKNGEEMQNPFRENLKNLLHSCFLLFRLEWGKRRGWFSWMMERMG